MKLTEWFPADVKPVRVGYYEVRNTGLPSKRSRYYLIGRPSRYWDGKIWRAWATGPASVFGQRGMHEWRGIKKT